MRHSAKPRQAAQLPSIQPPISMAPLNTEETSPEHSFTERCVTPAIGAARGSRSGLALVGRSDCEAD